MTKTIQSPSSQHKELTREQYLNGEVDHHTYYLHVANRSGYYPNVIAFRLHKAFKTKVLESVDESFNDIPLGIWDDLTVLVGNVYELHADGTKTGPSLSTKVCALKALLKEWRTDYYNDRRLPR